MPPVATRIGHAEWTAAAYRGLGIACETAGQQGRAESAYRRSLEAATDIPLFRAWAAARLGALLARQGRRGESAPHVQAALDQARDDGYLILVPRLRELAGG